MKACAVAVVSALLATIVKKDAATIAVSVSLMGICVLAAFVLTFIKPILAFVRELQALSGLQSTVLSPLIKAVAIGLLSEIASGVCADAGQSALGKFVQLCGAAAALYVALPLFEAVLNLLKSLNGG